MISKIISFIAFLLIIGLVIFIHEFGHYILAKKNGVGVVEFSIGMGPSIFSWVKNGTKYAVKWIPFGGYCMMLGDQTFVQDIEADGEEIVGDEEHAYSNKPVWVRIAVIAAGPIFNFVLAFVLALLLTGMIGTTTTEIGALSPGYPAEAAGLQPGDVITKLDHTNVRLFKELSLYLTMHEGEEIEVTYVRNGKKCTTTLVPKYSEEEGRYLIGIVSSGTKSHLNAAEVLKYGTYEFGYNTGIVIKSLGMLFTGKMGVNDLSGPVGMAGMVNEIVEDVQEDTKGESIWTTAYWILVNLISFSTLISANLGVMNLLPIPAMDGGRLIFLFWEAITGKPVAKKKEGIVTVVGFVLLALLMIFVFFNDIRKVFFLKQLF